MNRKRFIVEMVIYATAGLLFGGVFFRQIIASHFDLLVGDGGDARFNGLILEHWWQVFQGTAPWLSPLFFFPAQGVLGFSDAGFLYAIPYSTLRFTGIDPISSYQIVLFASVAAGWTGMILFLRCCLKLRIVPTIVGATIFVFPNAMAVSSGHTQLFAIHFIPYLAIGIYGYLRNFAGVRAFRILSGTFVAVIIPGMFYTSYYVGWFSLLVIAMLTGFYCLGNMFHGGLYAVYRDLQWLWEQRQKIWPYCVISAIFFIPFLLTYVPILLQYGGRNYSVVLTMLPSPIDYLNVGGSNWLWGNTLYTVFPNLDSRPMSWELNKGVPVCLFLFILGISAYYLRKTQYYERTLASDNVWPLATGRSEVDRERILSLLAAGLCGVVLLAWLLMLKIHGKSLWWFVWKLIPGARGVRAVYRFQLVLAFPIAVTVAVSLHQSLRYFANQAAARVKQTVGWVTIGACCILFVGEQYNFGNIANYGKHQQREMLAVISPPPQQAKVFALLPVQGGWQHSYEAQLDAMLIAQKYGLCTINGYSGQSPYGWCDICDINAPNYCRSLERWIEHYNLENDQLFFLDAKTGIWTLAKNLHASWREPTYAMQGPLGDQDYALQISAKKIPTQWQANESRPCVLHVKNHGNATLSSFGSDFDHAPKYGVHLSYRWVEMNESKAPLVGFDNRTVLPAPVSPGDKITLDMPVQAPSKPGQYRLEIEAVQELVAWFKSKGQPGLQIEVEVK
jgi:hypothetical protein